MTARHHHSSFPGQQFFSFQHLKIKISNLAIPINVATRENSTEVNPYSEISGRPSNLLG